jgi:hypothetical protein
MRRQAECLVHLRRHDASCRACRDRLGYVPSPCLLGERRRCQSPPLRGSNQSRPHPPPACHSTGAERFCRQIVPRDSGPQDIEDASEGEPVVYPRSSTPAMIPVSRQERRDLCPEVIGHGSNSHGVLFAPSHGERCRGRSPTRKCRSYPILTNIVNTVLPVGRSHCPRIVERPRSSRFYQTGPRGRFTRLSSARTSRSDPVGRVRLVQPLRVQEGPCSFPAPGVSRNGHPEALRYAYAT